MAEPTPPQSGRPVPAGYRFDAFELRAATRELLCEGAPVEVQPKVFDLIAFLIGQRERVVDKDELQDAIWPRQIVTEAALTRAVMKARKALGDHAERPRMIRTVHGRGYRFVAPVQELTDPVPAAPASAGGQRRVVAPLRWTLMVAVSLVTVASLLWVWRSERAVELPHEGERVRLAILPIENRSGNAAFDWAGLGLVGAVQDFLGSEPGIEVVPINEVLRLIETDTPALSTAQDLAKLAHRLALTSGATHVVTSRIESAPGRLRLVYRLADRDGHLRERTLYGADATALMRGLGSDLRALFGDSGSAAIPGDEYANEAYLRGKSALLRGELQEAEQHLKVAVSQAPESLWPRLDLAIIERTRRNFDDAEAQFVSLIDDARARGHAAVEFGAVTSLGNLYFMSERIELAEQRWRESLAIAEQRGEPMWKAKALQNLAIALRIGNDDAGARDLMLQALDAYARAGFEQPPPPLLMGLGVQAHREGDLASAERYTQQAVHGFNAIGAANAEAAAISNLANLRRDQGLLEESHALIAQSVGILRRIEHQQRGIGTGLANLAWIELLQGRFDEAQAHFDEALVLLEALPERLPLAYAGRRRGELLLARGDLDAADAVLAASLAHYREGRIEEGEAQVGVLQARLALARGDVAGAAQQATGLRERAAQSGWTEVAIEAGDVLAQAALAGNDPDRAQALWDEVAERCRSEHPASPWRWARLRQAAADAALEHGQPERARALLDEVAAILPHAPGLDAQRARMEADPAAPTATR